MIGFQQNLFQFKKYDRWVIWGHFVNRNIPASEDKMHNTIKVMDTGDETFFCITLSALKSNII